MSAVTPGPDITEVEPELLVLPGPKVVPGPITLVDELLLPPGPAALEAETVEVCELPVAPEILATLPSITVPPSITLPSIGTTASPARNVPATSFSRPALVCLDES